MFIKPGIKLSNGSGVVLYDALDAGLLSPNDLWEESNSTKWHTMLTHSTGLRVRDLRFLPPWYSANIPKKEEAFIDEFESLVGKYDNIIFGKISNIQLEDIYIRNGRSDKLNVGPEGGLEISMK